MTSIPLPTHVQSTLSKISPFLLNRPSSSRKGSWKLISSRGKVDPFVRHLLWIAAVFQLSDSMGKNSNKKRHIFRHVWFPHGLRDHDAGNHDNDDSDDDDDEAQSGLKYWNVSAWEPLKESIVSRHRAYCYFTHFTSSSSSPSPSLIWWKAAE